MDSALLARMKAEHTSSLAALVVEGDSMAPTLLAGDHLLVDLSDSASPRDGIYVIDCDSGPLVKRLSVNPVTQRIAILSDNAAYPSFPDCEAGSIGILGRVVWMGRPLG
jgi:phage repressor protein C with HTH and peptisase S24 domain